jgi:hypothetical protein
MARVTEYTENKLGNVKTRKKRGQILTTAQVNALERFRLERDLTYTQLASAVGLSYCTLHFAVNRRRIDCRPAFKIQRFLEGVRAA